MTAGLQIASLDVPAAVKVGDTVTLQCKLSLQGNERLYSLNWWRDEQIFYKFRPDHPKKSYNATLLNVDVRSVTIVGKTGVSASNSRQYFAPHHEVESTKCSLLIDRHCSKLDGCKTHVMLKVNNYPIKNYRGLSPNYRGQRWAYVHFIGGAANYPIIYP